MRARRSITVIALLVAVAWTTSSRGGAVITTTTRFSIESIRIGARAALLQRPQTRFPTYRVFDIAEWLERR